MKELISVIIPVYNNEKYFERCILSVINQTYKNIEIIVINDCSTDKVKDIIEKYKKIDMRILCYENENNMGVGYTRNKGLDIAKAKYVYFLDSDDYIEERCLELLYNSISPNDSFSCMLRGFKEINGIRTETFRTSEELLLLQSPSVDLRLFNKDIINMSGIKFSNLKITEDLEFIFKLLIFNENVSFVNEPLYTYVIHSDSSLRSNRLNQLDTLKAFDSICEFAKLNGKFEMFADRIEFAVVSHILFGTVNRIMSVENYEEEYIFKCVKYVNENFPNWKNNIYVQKYLLSNSKFKNHLKMMKKYGLIIK